MNLRWQWTAMPPPQHNEMVATKMVQMGGKGKLGSNTSLGPLGMFFFSKLINSFYFYLCYKFKKMAHFHPAPMQCQPAPTPPTNHHHPPSSLSSFTPTSKQGPTSTKWVFHHPSPQRHGDGSGKAGSFSHENWGDYWFDSDSVHWLL